VDSSVFNKSRFLNLKGQLVSLESPLVMGILNVTPDSFYDGGKYYGFNEAFRQVEHMVKAGVDIIDVGACSSRPGSDIVPVKEELDRLIPIASIIRDKYPELLLSIDTFRADVAKVMVLDYGFALVNDISAGRFDPEMFDTVARLNVPYLLMHMRGTPENMQDNPVYENLIAEITLFFAERVRELRLKGVNDIIIDPGFGFGKTLDHNFEILGRLNEFRVFDFPILAGISRKSMVYKVIDGGSDEALCGTSAAHMLALLQGANILRVHDVKAAVDCVKIFTKYKRINS
jgi:dihydropteroate synthase